MLPKYPEMNRITLLYPNPSILLGQELYWTEKRDGSQMRLALVDKGLVIATHHQEDASEQFKNYLHLTEQHDSLVQLLLDTNGYCDNPAANFNFGAVLFGELLSKGKSPARFEQHDKYEFVLFDIWSQKEERFIPYTALYQLAYHYSLPVVESWALTRHTTLESLFQYRDEMLSLAKEKGREGVVIKDYNQQTFVKEKLDTPKIERIKIEGGTVLNPALPDSEVFGAIAKVQADLGESFLDKTKAMPLIAQYVGEEQKKHLCSKPARNLFSYYQEYLEGKDE